MVLLQHRYRRAPQARQQGVIPHPRTHLVAVHDDGSLLVGPVGLGSTAGVALSLPTLSLPVLPVTNSSSSSSSRGRSVTG